MVVTTKCNARNHGVLLIVLLVAGAVGGAIENKPEPTQLSLLGIYWHTVKGSGLHNDASPRQVKA